MFSTCLSSFPHVAGPRHSFRDEVEVGRLGIGMPAGDNYHSWADPNELLKQDDVCEACKRPVKVFLRSRRLQSEAVRAGALSSFSQRAMVCSSYNCDWQIRRRRRKTRKRNTLHGVPDYLHAVRQRRWWKRRLRVQTGKRKSWTLKRSGYDR